MRAQSLLLIFAATTAFAPVAKADKYGDILTKGYRWVDSRGTFASEKQEDLRQVIDLNDVKGGEAKQTEMIRELRTTFLIPGTLVKLEQTDHGMCKIHVDGVSNDLWTYSQYLSKRPVQDTFGKVETLEDLRPPPQPMLSPRTAKP